MYSLNENHQFVIENFQDAHPFSSFLPGIVGKNGIPLWAFYVNRGQAMAGFGVENKNSPITEFFPADKSYQYVPLQGFRTFLKVNGKVFEPFASLKDNDSVKETLTISSNSISLHYLNEEKGIQLTVDYYLLPNSPIAGLVREVKVTNMTSAPLQLEMLDGIATIFPAGTADGAYKAMGNTLKSWFDVDTLNDQVNFYHIRGSFGDEAKVTDTKDGNFYTSLVKLGEKQEIVRPLYDRELVFGKDLSLRHSVAFMNESLSSLLEKDQVATNKVASGFTPVVTELSAGSTVELYTLIGYGKDRETVSNFVSENVNLENLTEWKKAASHFTEELTSAVETKTAVPLFDAYVKQNYLDNGLRGGFPTSFESKNNSKLFYLYARKHGDLERDYNFFSISPTYYSQGNGNYRDINQNRRLDVLLEPRLGDSNLKQFIDLIQLDGYNPLAIKEVRFLLHGESVDLSVYTNNAQDIEKLTAFFTKKFAPGDVKKYVDDHDITLNVSLEEFLADVLAKSDEVLEAEHGEGFWIDHWTYNLDLLDSYLAVYPDKVNDLYFEPKYRFFDSPANVVPRDEKYVLNNGVLRQYDAVVVDEKKRAKQQQSREQWVRREFGSGSVYQTNLFSKLFLLATVKTATIAPYGLGIEMEANKPGWNDALNGLPGMFGSSTSELYELKRLLEQLKETTVGQDGKVTLPMEGKPFVDGIVEAIQQLEVGSKEQELTYWKQVTNLREDYRRAILEGIQGDSFELTLQDAIEILHVFEKRVTEALKAVDTYQKGKLVPTYFYFEAQGKAEKISDIEAFTPHAVTPFLEGVVKKLKLTDSVEEAEAIYRAVRSSAIYDEKLGMYKTSGPVAKEPIEIGRAKHFTPGWLENESIFMHMEYKYLLEMLKKGLTNEFFADIKTALVPFQDPAVYGRSTLENSSFIASSANPDPAVHGRGYVARLSGSTVELLNMWLIMFAGKKPFRFNQAKNELSFALTPTLPAWLFREDGTCSFTLFSSINVTYHNKKRQNTFGTDKVVPVKYVVRLNDGQVLEVAGDQVAGEAAEAIRGLKVASIDVELA